MSGLTPLQRYEHELAHGRLTPDPSQYRVVLALQGLHDALCARAGRRSWLRRLLRLAAGGTPRGLYIWGSVGRGKTHLVDAFYESLPFPEKARAHFHVFMQSVHRELATLKQRTRPLEVCADRYAQRARVLCLDEFHVADITDAMILSGLLGALFRRGVTLVTTSNDAPERLYWQGLQRERFLPAIALLRDRLTVLHLDGGEDHRLRALERAPVYYVPADAGAERALALAFARIAGESGGAGGTLHLEGRAITVQRLASGVVWFDFDVLCRGARSAADYIEIARRFHTVVLARIPVLTAEDDDAVRRLVTAVDEFYDRAVKLIVSAAAAPEGLYTGRRLRATFARTASRLIEMQSHDYLARPHRSQ